VFELLGSAQVQSPDGKKAALPMPTTNATIRTQEAGPPPPIHPADKSALKCELVEWVNEAPKPILTIACPPQDVYAPLRIYFGFSWERAEEVPPNAGQILVTPKTLTRVHFSSNQALIWLKVSEKGEKPREQWVQFTAITRIGISSGP
jgi:hypothetical protein